MGIAVLDPEFNILSWNPEMERIYNLPYTEIKGKNYLEIIPPFIQNRRDIYLIKTLAGEKVQAPDYQYPTEEPAKQLWISCIYSPVYDLRHNIIGVIINVYDITDRKESENDLKRAYDVIHVAQEKLSILSSITRHDILNRVQVINIYCEILL